jgi:hypothetical protein
MLGKAPVATLTVWQREVRPGLYAPRAEAFVRQVLAASEHQPRRKPPAKPSPRKRAADGAAKPARAPRGRGRPAAAP